MIRILPFAAALALAALLPAGPARADELQAQVLAGIRATQTDGLGFRRTLTNETTGQPRKTIVEQYDPRRAPADRWTLVSIDGRPPNAKEAADARKAKRGPVPSYARLGEWFAAPATRSDAGAGRVLYRFARLPAGTLKLNNHDASADTRAEALVNTAGRTPFVERIRFVMSKPFRMMLVASVQSMTVDSRYERRADGTVVPAGGDNVITGAMMGKSGQMRTRVDYDFASR